MFCGCGLYGAAPDDGSLLILSAPAIPPGCSLEGVTPGDR